MQKHSIQNVNLLTHLQQNDALNEGHCYKGVFTKVSEIDYLFEEAASCTKANVRNPKLFAGEYISLVHMQNGRYQVHCRTIVPYSTLDINELAFKVYSELLPALHQMHPCA